MTRPQREEWATVVHPLPSGSFAILSPGQGGGLRRTSSSHTSLVACSLTDRQEPSLCHEVSRTAPPLVVMRPQVFGELKS